MSNEFKTDGGLHGDPPLPASTGSDATIVNLAGEPVTVIKERAPGEYCWSHCQDIRVDPHSRQLTCRECGAVVDAFGWVCRMAMEESRLLSRIKTLRNSVIDHEKRVESLKADEQRIKARIRAAKDSLLKSAGV